MKILFCGDIVGKSGRNAIATYIPKLKKDLNIDLVVANAENSAHGFGFTPKIYHELSEYGIEVFTLGNHFFDQPIIGDYLDKYNNIIRPLNVPDNTPGKGYAVIEVKGYRILIISVLGQLFMKNEPPSPFLVLDNILNNFKLKENIDLILVDIHAETTSEKNALFLYLDGRVSAAIGTHTHIPTIDYRVLPKGTAVQTDVGMCGDYSGVVGMEFSSSLSRFLSNNEKTSSKVKQRLTPATKFVTLSATLINFDIVSGLATSICPIIMGDILQTHLT